MRIKLAFVLIKKKKKKQNANKAEKSGKTIFPPIKQVFRCFELCPREQLKVVLLGQDPYHDDRQAEGLCFSVAKGIALPSSLRNIFKEAKNDVGFEAPGHGSLVHWGMQGVLLLNTALTVEAHKANSHSKFGWHEFTDSVIKAISKLLSGVVFILWGKEAQKKAAFIDQTKHKIITSAHPSGLSANRESLLTGRFRKNLHSPNNVNFFLNYLFTYKWKENTSTGQNCCKNSKKNTIKANKNELLITSSCKMVFEQKSLLIWNGINNQGISNFTWKVSNRLYICYLQVILSFLFRIINVKIYYFKIYIIFDKFKSKKLDNTKYELFVFLTKILISIVIIFYEKKFQK
ncbi:uracil-DNA glycosylase [Reticulomyxa filosa]|uniref:Uracil-DNA glycosylase n=1 Tax=Reticulomyxa filosa TaxID=46433 RepID=X6NRT7_RETFI|nr:uracil-DNA glycosylase [Reticulomyxa filosa]|eukprot:ETO28995.1 uracil-DNA glycosylase [Reticulomyxa filosa]